MLKVNTVERAGLLHQAADDFGYDSIHEMFETAMFDSTSPAICPICGYTTEYEPDQDKGWCENCEKNTVVSVLVLGGII